MQVQTLATIGRIILGLYFLAAGAGKIFNPAPPEQIAHMVAYGIPWPELNFTLAAACEATAGLCFIIGLHVRLVAMLLALFTVGVSVLLHAFWKEAGHEQFVQMIMFMKNFATAGGLLAFAGFGAGPLALDRWFGVKD
jgi:putative oxidoreductase